MIRKPGRRVCVRPSASVSGPTSRSPSTGDRNWPFSTTMPGATSQRKSTLGHSAALDAKSGQKSGIQSDRCSKRCFPPGRASGSKISCFQCYRHGYTEECYFNFTFSPIRGENGGSEGIFNAVVETTFQVIGERRERALRELAEHLATARSEQDVLSAALSMLGSKVEDVPFCALFMAADDGSTQRLVGTAGSEVDGNKLLPLGNSTDPRPFVVEDLAEVLGRKTPSQAWPEPVDRALAVPFGTVVRLTQSSFHHPLQRRFRSRIFSHCQHGRR